MHGIDGQIDQRFYLNDVCVVGGVGDVSKNIMRLNRYFFTNRWFIGIILAQNS